MIENNIFKNQFEQHQLLIQELFDLNNSIRCLLNTHKNDESIKLKNLIFTKTTRLLKCTYILINNNFGQESGALLRPAIEGYELLDFLREFPDQIHNAFSHTLPSPGEIAKRINGGLKVVREYLNTHASHLSISYYSMTNLIEPEIGDIIIDDKVIPEVLISNYKVLSVLLMSVNFEGMKIIEEVNELPQEIFDKYQEIRSNISKLYQIEYQ